MPALQARDDDLPLGYVREDGDIVPWWYSDTGIIVKWTLFFTISAILFAWIVGGYIHAKSRIRKGLPLLKYHRWLVSRQVAHPQPTYTTYYPPQQNGYPMHNMPPPPVYDPSRPPMYEGPPEGGSKVDPEQGRMDPAHRAPETNPAPEYEAPSGPPPSAMR